MKKWLGFSLFLGLFLLKYNVLGVSWHYEWENTYVEVPLYASLNAYDDIPQAKLYRDGIYLNDANISYNRIGDWLYYYKDVDTTKPGDYKVWYKVSESKYVPGDCPNYKQLITFHVYDDIAPKITILQPEINLPLGSKKVDFNEFFKVSDNLGLPQVNVNSDGVDYNQIGTYYVYIEALDAALNSTKAKLTINIIDNAGPVITFLGKDDLIILEKNSTTDLKEYFMDYFKAIDSIDGNVTGSLEYSYFAPDKLGETSVNFSFYDQYHNESSMRVMVRVVDEIEPVIILTTDNLKLDYKTVPNEAYYRQFIKEAYDGIVDKVAEVEIDFSEIEQAVGNYNVYYKLVDDKGNETIKSLVVNYLTDKAPEIKTTDVKLKEGETVDFTNYVEVVDDSDPNVKANLKIDTTDFNNKLPGIYYLNVTVFNSSGLFANTYLKVEVVSSKMAINPLNIILIIALIGLIVGFAIYMIVKYKKRKKLPNFE